jgi:hypothetical protein
MSKMSELDMKRQQLIDDMVEDCNNDPRFLKQMVEDYIWTFNEDLVELLYDGRE